MALAPSWIDTNFNSIQTIGIIGSLWLGIWAACREARAKEIEVLLSLSDHHRALWSETTSNGELERVFQNELDLARNPVTVAEIEFLNLAITHFMTSWRIAKAGGLISPSELQTDAKAFFAFPMPRTVWERTKQFRNKNFVRFMEASFVS